MADDQRVYSDEEFALILHKAAELANRAEFPATSSEGLTLAEMKEAASQAGFEPALIEKAARLVATSVPPSPLERLTGGPLRHRHEIHLPIKLDEDKAAQLLSAVRITASLAGHTDVGHSSAMGMTWHDGGDVESFSVIARPDEDGTTVVADLNRRGTLALVMFGSGVTSFLATMFGAFALYPESPALGVAGTIAGVGGVLALARTYWASSTRKVRERIRDVLDTIEQTLEQAPTHAPESLGKGKDAPVAGADAALVSDSDADGTNITTS
jgi:hypothetical protein